MNTLCNPLLRVLVSLLTLLLSVMVGNCRVHRIPAGDENWIVFKLRDLDTRKVDLRSGKIPDGVAVADGPFLVNSSGPPATRIVDLRLVGSRTNPRDALPLQCTSMYLSWGPNEVTEAITRGEINAGIEGFSWARFGRGVNSYEVAWDASLRKRGRTLVPWRWIGKASLIDELLMIFGAYPWVVNVRRLRFREEDFGWESMEGKEPTTSSSCELTHSSGSVSLSFDTIPFVFAGARFSRKGGEPTVDGAGYFGPDEGLNERNRRGVKIVRGTFQIGDVKAPLDVSNMYDYGERLHLSGENVWVKPEPRNAWLVMASFADCVDSYRAVWRVSGRRSLRCMITRLYNENLFELWQDRCRLLKNGAGYDRGIPREGLRLRYRWDGDRCRRTTAIAFTSVRYDFNDEWVHRDVRLNRSFASSARGIDHSERTRVSRSVTQMRLSKSDMGPRKSQNFRWDSRVDGSRPPAAISSLIAESRATRSVEIDRWGRGRPPDLAWFPMLPEGALKAGDAFHERRVISLYGFGRLHVLLRRKLQWVVRMGGHRVALFSVSGIPLRFDFPGGKSLRVDREASKVAGECSFDLDEGQVHDQALYVLCRFVEEATRESRIREVIHKEHETSGKVSPDR